MTLNGSGPLGEVEYAELIARIRAGVTSTVPPGASVLVINKGDPALLDMPGLIAAHFPQDSSGGYAGHHPIDSAAVIAAVEDLRRRGAEYLVIPATARWWLDYYEGFAKHLATHCELLADRPDSHLIYDLGNLARGKASVPAISRLQAPIDQMRDFLENLTSIDTSLVVLEATDGITAGLAPLNAVRLVPGEEGEDELLLGELQRFAAAGAGYLVVPRSADEWLERRAELSGQIEGSCRKVADQRHLCRVFDLSGLNEAPV